MIKLKDKTFVITGGTSDVGRALALNLTSLGADIAILDKNPEKARRIVDEISETREVKESFGKAAYFEVNLTDHKAVKEAVSKAAETFGGIDVLIGGLFTSKVSLINSPDYLEEFERMIDINTKSAVYTTQAIVPFMRGRKRGKIIYLISDLVRWGSEGESILAISRGGIIYYARSLARELASSNIAVNCVAMGPTEDYLLARDPSASSIKVTEEKLLAAMPMGRTLRADEIAQVVTFLSSPLADAVTGQTWSVNGGLTMF
ncbi:MAG: SDR family oxidoreductase [Oligoflexia bacterium]|nr:SDR family oxidoreductase [Oligoflexia bacterium]